MATFDPLAAMAEPDEVQLEALLKGIETDNDALAALLDDLAKEAQAGMAVAVTEDDVPEPPDEAITKSGNLLILGNHRLLCEDSITAQTGPAMFRLSQPLERPTVGILVSPEAKNLQAAAEQFQHVRTPIEIRK